MPCVRCSPQVLIPDTAYAHYIGFDILVMSVNSIPKPRDWLERPPTWRPLVGRGECLYIDQIMLMRFVSSVIFLAVVFFPSCSSVNLSSVSMI